MSAPAVIPADLTNRVAAYLRAALVVPRGASLEVVRLANPDDDRPWIRAEIKWIAPKDGVSASELRHEAQSFIDALQVDLDMAYSNSLIDIDARHPRHIAMTARVFGPMPLNLPILRAASAEAAE